MFYIALFISIVFAIAIFPMLVPFLLASYIAMDGIGSRHFIYNLKVSAGGTNIFLPDLLYAASFLLALFGIIRLFTTGRLKKYASLSSVAILLVILYFMLFVIKLISGYLDHVHPDSLVRTFSGDTQCVYFFLPLFYLKHEKYLKYLLLYVLSISLVFPLIQPILYGSADQVYLSEGQGTLRLGFGNANLLLMLGILSLFVWERRIWLSALPLAGIAMLGQRSAFIALSVCVFTLSVQKKKSIKFISLVGIVGALLIAVLMIIQSSTTIPVFDKAEERFSQTFQKTGTTKARLRVIPVAMDEIYKRPWTGYSYEEVDRLKQKQNKKVFAFNMLHPHNFVLSSLLRTGVLGTMLLFSIVGTVMIAALRLTLHRNTRLQGLYLFSTILFFVVFGVMNTSFFSAGYIFWLLAGITFWYSNHEFVRKSR